MWIADSNRQGQSQNRQGIYSLLLNLFHLLKKRSELFYTLCEERIVF
jgi:hypothetical protein